MDARAGQRESRFGVRLHRAVRCCLERLPGRGVVGGSQAAHRVEGRTPGPLRSLRAFPRLEQQRPHRRNRVRGPQIRAWPPHRRRQVGENLRVAGGCPGPKARAGGKLPVRPESPNHGHCATAKPDLIAGIECRMANSGATLPGQSLENRRLPKMLWGGQQVCRRPLEFHLAGLGISMPRGQFNCEERVICTDWPSGEIVGTRSRAAPVQ